MEEALAFVSASFSLVRGNLLSGSVLSGEDDSPLG